MDETARYYDDYWDGEAPPDTDPRTPRRLEIFEALVPRSAKVLDVGCGRGRCSRALSRAGYRVVGIDISERAVSEARAAVPDAEFYVRDLASPLPFPDASFGAAFMTDVIEHVFDPLTVIREVSRILSPGGHFLISTPYHGLVKNVLIALFRFDRHFDPQGPHIRFFSRGSLTRLLRGTGFGSFSYFYLGRLFPVSKNLVIMATKT
jgi:SAM-dependent methyltransferase